MKKFIGIIGNAIWFMFTGFELGLIFVVLGIIWCMTVVGVPFGIQCFQIAYLVFFPGGKSVDLHFEKYKAANIVWIIFGGFIISALFIFLGILWGMTIIGIMKAKKCFKFAKLALMPFGAEITDDFRPTETLKVKL